MFLQEIYNARSLNGSWSVWSFVSKSVQIKGEHHPPLVELPKGLPPGLRKQKFTLRA